MYCLENDIKDTTRGYVYHNKWFHDEAVKRGIELTYDKTIGWSCTEPSKELRSFVVKQHWVNKLNMQRQGEPVEEPGKKVKRPSSTRKYICPGCGLSIRATRDVLLFCGECMLPLEKVMDIKRSPSTENG